MFDTKSRYFGVPERQVTDRKGQTVTVADPAPPAIETLRGRHILRQGERLDHLASQYLEDPAAYWRICELNGIMLPDALAMARELGIPNKK